jgi:hypothetical protein
MERVRGSPGHVSGNNEVSCTYPKDIFCILRGCKRESPADTIRCHLTVSDPVRRLLYTYRVLLHGRRGYVPRECSSIYVWDNEGYFRGIMRG